MGKKKGYANLMLSLALPIAKEPGIKKVLDHDLA
jgi:predicted acetyltransferase